jgi:antitoxin component YwqK of YwqJK toxin-antitoxin module
MQNNSRIIKNSLDIASRVLLPVICFVICQTHSIDAQVFRGYYPNGTVKFVMKKNRKRQIIRGYYPSGALEFIAFYRKGELDGITREYYEDGILKAEIPYKENRRHGLAKFYYDNGILMGKITYKRGRETGEAKFYDTEGLLISSTPRIRRHTRRSKPYEHWVDKRIDSLGNKE